MLLRLILMRERAAQEHIDDEDLREFDSNIEQLSKARITPSELTRAARLHIAQFGGSLFDLTVVGSI